MIKLTGKDGKPIYFSPDRIYAVYDGGHGTSVNVAEETVYVVDESPEEVVKKIMDYKLDIAKHNGSDNLRILAGLQEAPHD